MASWNGAQARDTLARSNGYGAQRSGLRTNDRGRDRARGVASLFLLVAFVLSIASALTPWWYDTITYGAYLGAPSASMDFLPGTTSSIDCTALIPTSSPCTSVTNWDYAGSGLYLLGSYYVLVHVVTILCAVLALVGGSFMAMHATRRGWGRWHFHTTHLLALLVGILLLVVPAVVVTGQPGLMGQATTGSGPYDYFLGPEGQYCGANTPSTGYFGNCTFTISAAFSPATYNASWGAGLGWYLSVIGAFFALLGGVLFLRAGADDEARVAPRPYSNPYWAEGGLASGGAGGPVPLVSDARELVPALGYEGAPILSNRTSCRSCGHLNPPGSVLCTRCHGPLS